MSSSTFGRRPFLLGTGLSLGALLVLPTAAARAGGGKVAIPLAKLEVLKSVGGSIALKVKDKLLLLDLDGHVVHGPASRSLETYAAELAGEQVIVTL